MKVFSGVIKKVLTEEQYELISKDLIKPEEIEIEDTIRTKELEGDEELKYLPFRVSYKEVDFKGNDKYVFNEEKDEYQKVYKISPIIYAYNKEMRIILELGEFSPVKICARKVDTEEDRSIFRLVCVQDQLCGKL